MLFEHKSAVSKPRPAVTLDTEGVTRWNGGWGILLQVGPDAWLMTRRWMLCSSILMCLGMFWLLSSLVFGACQKKLIVRLRRYAQSIRTWGLCKLGGESPHFAHNRLQWCSDSLRPIVALTHTVPCLMQEFRAVQIAHCACYCLLFTATDWLQICSSIALFCRSNFCYVFRPTEAIVRETLIQKVTSLIRNVVVGVRKSNKIAVKTRTKLIIKLIIN